MPWGNMLPTKKSIRIESHSWTKVEAQVQSPRGLDSQHYTDPASRFQTHTAVLCRPNDGKVTLRGMVIPPALAGCQAQLSTEYFVGSRLADPGGQQSQSGI